MTAWRVSAMPEVDGAGRVRGLHALSDVVGPAALPNTAVVMAGGRGTRLGDLTRPVPKPLMRSPAGPSSTGSSWASWATASGGYRSASTTSPTRSSSTSATGEARGRRSDYLREDPDRPLGTAGSLAPDPAERLDHACRSGDERRPDGPVRAQQLLGFHEDRAAGVTVATRPTSTRCRSAWSSASRARTGSPGSGEADFTVDVSAGV